MKDNIAQLALAIASLGLSDRDLRVLLTNLQHISIEDLIQRITVLHESSVRWSKANKSSDLQLDLLHKVDRDMTVGQRVERLLKLEARLTTSSAVEELTRRMVRDGLLSEEEVPPLSKKALRLWIDRVIQQVSPKEVLRHATILRNEFVHTPQADWPIGPTVE